ncbi:sugar nucleotide-binding protein [Aeromonas veronii]
MSIVLFGTGQLARALSLVSHKVYRPIVSLPRAYYPQVNDKLLREVLPCYRPKVILNAAAYTDVVGAEQEPELAMAVNCDGVARLGKVRISGEILLG